MSLHFHHSLLEHYPGLVDRLHALKPVLAGLELAGGNVLGLYSPSADEVARLTVTLDAIVRDFRARVCEATLALGQGADPAGFEPAIERAVKIAAVNALLVGLWTGQERLCGLPDPSAR